MVDTGDSRGTDFTMIETHCDVFFSYGYLRGIFPRPYPSRSRKLTPQARIPSRRPEEEDTLMAISPDCHGSCSPAKLANFFAIDACDVPRQRAPYVSIWKNSSREDVRPLRSSIVMLRMLSRGI